MLHQWARNYVKKVPSKMNPQNNPIHTFLCVTGETGSFIWLKLYTKLNQKSYFVILQNQINRFFSFWVQKF